MNGVHQHRCPAEKRLSQWPIIKRMAVDDRTARELLQLITACDCAELNEWETVSGVERSGVTAGVVELIVEVVYIVVLGVCCAASRSELLQARQS
jgi:hypothetical protein